MTKYLNDPNLQIALTEYRPLSEGNKAVAYDGTEIGYVDKVYDNEHGDGEQVYAVIPEKTDTPEEVKHVTVLFRGSTGMDNFSVDWGNFMSPTSMHSSLTQDQKETNNDIVNDWVVNDIILASRILYAQSHSDSPDPRLTTDRSTNQLKAASEALQAILERYPNATFSAYGHSLGSMDAQYALANLSPKQQDRLIQAHVYNGPNVYPILSSGQQAAVDQIKYKIFNYIDQYDFIGMWGNNAGAGSNGTVGFMSYLQTKDLGMGGTTAQHMTEAYEMDAYGNIKRDPLTTKIYYSESRKYLLKGVTSFLASHQATKQSLGQGGYSDHEKIYLDSVQAVTISESLKTISDGGADQIGLLRDQAIAEMEEAYVNAMAAAELACPHLTQTEIEDAFAAAGATYSATVLELTDYFNDKYDQMKAIADNYASIATQITEGVNAQLEADAQLAKEFIEWNQLTTTNS